MDNVTHRGLVLTAGSVDRVVQGDVRIEWIPSERDVLDDSPFLGTQPDDEFQHGMPPLHSSPPVPTWLYSNVGRYVGIGALSPPRTRYRDATERALLLSKVMGSYLRRMGRELSVSYETHIPRPQSRNPEEATVSLAKYLESTLQGEQLQRRLDRAEGYFRRKAAEIITDDTALGFLDTLHAAAEVDLAVFGVSERGLALAKLTAAGFVEIGDTVAYITEAGKRYVDELVGNQDWYWTQEWQDAEREATEDIKAGRVTRLSSAEDIKAHFRKLR